MTPAGLAGRPLFEPIAPLLARFTGGLPGVAQLDALLHEHAPGAVSGSGQPIRFVPPPVDLPAYEQWIRRLQSQDMVNDISRYFGRRLFQHFSYGKDDVLDHIMDRNRNILGVDFQSLGQAVDRIPASYFHGAIGSCLFNIGTTDRYFDVFGSPLAYQQTVLFADELNDCLIHPIATGCTGTARNNSAKRNRRDIRRTAANIDHH